MKKTKIILKFVNSIVFTISFVGIIVGVSLFWVGIHNSDMCQNWRVLEEKYNESFTETSLRGNTIPVDDCYMLGVLQMIIGYFISISSFFIFGGITNKK